MEIRRGSIVLAAGPGEYSRKPRPFLVVQSDLFNNDHGSISLCPITSRVQGLPLFRVRLDADAETGLAEDSEVQVDKVQSLRRNRIVRSIGRASPAAMTLTSQALRRWLQL